MVNKRLNHSLHLDLYIKSPGWDQYSSLINEENIKNIINFTLRKLKFFNYAKDIELSVILASDEEIKQYNLKYRNQNKPTNVLSFPVIQLNPEKYEEIKIFNDHILLGDIILAIETIENEAKMEHKPLANHFTHLLIHGILHLLGFDHNTESEAMIMQKLEVETLKNFDIVSPYG